MANKLLEHFKRPPICFAHSELYCVLCGEVEANLAAELMAHDLSQFGISIRLGSERIDPRDFYINPAPDGFGDRL